MPRRDPSVAHWVCRPSHFVTVVRPTYAGMDPYNELIVRDSDDNTVAVKVSQALVG